MTKKKTTAKERIDKELGMRLATARKAKGYTQSQMAEFFGITQPAYQNYEYGREIRSSMIVQLCELLECSTSWLLGVKDEGEHLDPEDPIMRALHIACDKLNDKGKKKVVTYAEDLSCNPEMVIDVKSGDMQDDRVSGVA